MLLVTGPTHQSLSGLERRSRGSSVPTTVFLHTVSAQIIDYSYPSSGAPRRALVCMCVRARTTVLHALAASKVVCPIEAPETRMSSYI